MSTVPDKLLENLKCFICNGYLSSAPVVVNSKNQQICAKCYKILPQWDKNKCLRQISYETIASTMTFPCMYHKMGCEFTFLWNTNQNHESECSKKYFTYPDVVGINNNTENGVTNNYYNLNESSDSLNFGSATTVSEDTITKPLIPPVNNAPIYENFYETVPSSFKKYYEKCCNCQIKIKNGVYTCLFGHTTCSTCKGELCVICFKNFEGTSRKCCKNLSRGCKEKLLDIDVANHRDNCKFNIQSCPFETCEEKDTLDNLIFHIKQHHSDNVYEKNELSIVLNKQDKVFVFLIYESAFKCAYYYYSSYIEVFVTYLGPSDQARNFVFEASVLTNTKLNKKRREVANWNNNMLASGVTFEKKEFMGSGEKRFTMEMELKILHNK